MKEQVQWDLLPEEKSELRRRICVKNGNTKLIEALQRALGEQAFEEAAWWESLRLRLGLPVGSIQNLVANHELGKVWVKGKVGKLDITTVT